MMRSECKAAAAAAEVATVTFMMDDGTRAEWYCSLQMMYITTHFERIRVDLHTIIGDIRCA